LLVKGLGCPPSVNQSPGHGGFISPLFMTGNNSPARGVPITLLDGDLFSLDGRVPEIQE
jgi:hypothetical protein